MNCLVWAFTVLLACTVAAKKKCEFTQAGRRLGCLSIPDFEAALSAAANNTETSCFQLEEAQSGVFFLPSLVGVSFPECNEGECWRAGGR